MHTTVRSASDTDATRDGGIGRTAAGNVARVGSAILLAVALAACSTAGASPSAPVPSEAAPSEAAPSEAAPSEVASPAPSDDVPATVALAETSLGSILVDPDGKTLYAFLADTAGDPTCYETCAENWPPLIAEDAAAIGVGAGLDASLLTTVARTDGTTQVKYGAWPLYYFANDAAAGDVNGQGLNDKWYVIGANGETIDQAPAAGRGEY